MLCAVRATGAGQARLDEAKGRRQAQATMHRDECRRNRAHESASRMSAGALSSDRWGGNLGDLFIRRL